MKPAPSSTVRFKIRGKSFNAGQRDSAGDLSTGPLLFTSQGTYLENQNISPREEKRWPQFHSIPQPSTLEIGQRPEPSNTTLP